MTLKLRYVDFHTGNDIRNVSFYTDNDVRNVKFYKVINSNPTAIQLKESPICQRFKNLWRIDAYYLKSVEDDLLQQCSNLRIFILSYLEATEIPEKIFLKLKNLTLLSLYRNKFITLPENLFLNLEKLKKLDLSHNQISCLPSNIFKSLTKLQDLDLSFNQNLQSLEILDLSDNKIKD
jgi:Leucine-rich repeat (LRR) protein